MQNNVITAINNLNQRGKGGAVDPGAEDCGQHIALSSF